MKFASDAKAAETLVTADLARVRSAVDAAEVRLPKEYEFDALTIDPLVSRAELTGLVSSRVDPERLSGSFGRVTDPTDEE